MKRMTRVGLITSGGDCQGLNAAIRGVGKALLQSVDNVEIFGMRDGYRGLIECDYDFMGPGAFSGILTEGGTILGTSRQPYIPGKAIVDDEGNDLMPAMMDTYNRLNLDCLVVMGGNGTQKSAKLLQDAGMNIMGIITTTPMKFSPALVRKPDGGILLRKSLRRCRHWKMRKNTA